MLHAPVYAAHKHYTPKIKLLPKFPPKISTSAHIGSSDILPLGFSYTRDLVWAPRQRG